jgi:DNA-binding transcriptional regulator YdaS (Cro superfamily)
MDKLRAYLNSLTTREQFFFAERCGTTVGYLRKRLSLGGNFGPEIVMAIERESKGAVLCDDLRPDIDWSHFRATLRRRKAAAA